MARGGGAEAGEEAHPLRWLDAARYAAASMVTVLILIVVVKATKVVLFPDSLYVSVVHGSVFAKRRAEQLYVPPPLAAHGGRLDFMLSLRIGNPRRLASMDYVNITAYLFDNDTPASSPDPDVDSIAYFIQGDILVTPQLGVTVTLTLHLERNTTMEPRFFDLLYNNESASMSGVTMRMDAMLLTEHMTSGGVYNTSRRVSYYCWPLVILHHRNLPDDAVDDDLRRLGDDVFCRDVRGSHFF